MGTPPGTSRDPSGWKRREGAGAASCSFHRVTLISGVGLDLFPLPVRSPMYSQPEKNETCKAPPYKPPPTAPPAPRNKVEQFFRNQLDVFHRHPAMFFFDEDDPVPRFAGSSLIRVRALML